MNETRKKTLLKALKHMEGTDEIRTFSHGKRELIRLNGMLIERMTFEPGWRKSTSELPAGETRSFRLHLSGTMKMVMDNDVEFEFSTGDISRLNQCRDAWVEGNEAVVTVHFQEL
jgi:hypothetical protein